MWPASRNVARMPGRDLELVVVVDGRNCGSDRLASSSCRAARRGRCRRAAAGSGGRLGVDGDARAIPAPKPAPTSAATAVSSDVASEAIVAASGAGGGAASAPDGVVGGTGVPASAPGASPSSASFTAASYASSSFWSSADRLVRVPPLPARLALRELLLEPAASRAGRSRPARTSRWSRRSGPVKPSRDDDAGAGRSGRGGRGSGGSRRASSGRSRAGPGSGPTSFGLPWNIPQSMRTRARSVVEQEPRAGDGRRAAEEVELHRAPIVPRAATGRPRAQRIASYDQRTQASRPGAIADRVGICDAPIAAATSEPDRAPVGLGARTVNGRGGPAR